MSAAALTSELRYVPVALIDEPEIAMRQGFDPVAMEELAQSIRVHGVLQSLVLIQHGERFRVAAGHRRKIAAAMANLKTVPALVFPEGTPTEEAMKCTENLAREKVNPIDEALYFARLFTERCGSDVFALCGLVGKTQSYVEGRLNLLTGYEDVVLALQNNRITLSVAIELNKYKDEGFAKMDLATAIECGYSSRYIARMRTEREQLHERYPQQVPPADAPTDYQAPPPPRQECAVCGEGHDPWNLDVIFIHRGGPCKKILDRALGPAAAGGE